MSLGKSTILLALVVAVSGQFPIQQRPPAIRFFMVDNCRPPVNTVPQYYEYTATKNVSSEQPQQGYGSYCVVRGAWRVEFTWVQNNYDFNISVGDSCGTCISRGTGSPPRRYGYVQRLTGADLAKASFHLYTDTFFQGREVQVAGWEHTFNDTFTFSSIAFSSFSNWTWQTYYLPRFRGSSTCYRPNIGSEVTLINPISVQVGSIRLGCRNSGPALRYRDPGIMAFIIITLLAIPSYSSCS